MKKIVLLLSLALLALGGYAGTASSTERTPSPPAPTAPDNTGRNVRDRGGATMTPGDQSEREADRTVTQQIRRALGWLAGIGALAIPGLGPFIAAGPIMAALSGAAAGAALGGIAGALIGLGIPEYEAKRYEGKIREGHVLISVHTDDRTERSRAKEILERAGAQDVADTSEARV
jgi:hypothetical protein